MLVNAQRLKKIPPWSEKFRACVLKSPVYDRQSVLEIIAGPVRKKRDEHLLLGFILGGGGGIKVYIGATPLISQY